MTSGTSSRWLPDRIDRPTTSGSSSRADAAICAGVSRMPGVHDLHAGVAGRYGDLLGAVGMAVEARLGHEQSRWSAGHGPHPRRHRRPVRRRRRPAAAETPVGAWNSPKTSRRASDHSPVVPPAWARAIVGRHDVLGRRRRPAQVVECPLHRGRRRGAAATACTSATISASTAGSTRRIDSAVSSGETSVSVNRLTPTTTCSPDSMRRVRSARDRTSRPFSSSIASNAPPSRQHLVQLRRGRGDEVRRLRLDHLRAVEDVARTRAGRSRRPSTCCIRNDHCWSHGRGRPRASFHAGSWTDRARARLDSVTASISSTMRWTLFSGCASVRPRLLTWTP